MRRRCRLGVGVLLLSFVFTFPLTIATPPGTITFSFTHPALSRSLRVCVCVRWPCVHDRRADPLPKPHMIASACAPPSSAGSISV
uniref:Putative secreted protein n=1 Tax=Anopheles darlingi TaxID=43151 RepID=A0A2M4D7N5_ANODA